MPKTLRIKRRRSGSAGPPASLLNAELAFNEVSGVLYYGSGISAGNVATSIIEIGGSGAFVNLAGAQTITGAKTFTVSPAAPTPSTADNSTAVATTAFVKAQNYAALVDGLIPSNLLPSFVDDVLEFAAVASFPATGETSKIYVALDTNKTYRWSGSQYVEISSTPGTSDSLTEGVTNLYFTAARSSAIQSSLAGKASLSHTHQISDVTNLTTILDVKLSNTDLIDGGAY